MFENLMAGPIHFTIELFGFLVTGGGALLVWSRPNLIPGPPSNRMNAAIGLGALALAQVIHGGVFAVGDTDGDRLLLALHTMGLALMLIGVVGTLRPSFGGFVVVEPVAFVPAAVGVLLGGMALAGALRERRHEQLLLALAALGLAAADALTSAAPHIRFGVENVTGYAYGAHVAKFAGFLALGTWLWIGARSSLRTRFVASFGVLLLAVVLVLSTALTGVIANNVEAEELRRLRTQLANAVDAIQDRDATELTRDVNNIAAQALVREQFTSPETLQAFAENIVEARFWEMDFIILMEPTGRVLAQAARESVKRKPADADVVRIAGSRVALETIGGEPFAASLVQIRDAASLLAAARVAHHQIAGQTAGIILIGQFIDERTVERVSADAAVPATLVVGDRIVATTLPRRIRAANILPPSFRPELATGEVVTLEHSIAGRTFFSAAVALKNAVGDPIDASFVLSSPGRIVTETREGVIRTLFIVAMGVGAIALGLAWLFGQRITRPIQELTVTARAVREGDLTARAHVGGEDEVGQLGETFDEMTASLLRMTDDLREAAAEEQRLRARIETIIQSMADGLIAVDARRRILAFNREAENLTGVGRTQAVGAFVEDVVDARDANGEKVRLPIFELAEGSVPGVLLFRPRGAPIAVAVTSAVLRSDDGRVGGGVAVLRDMTREREIERMKSEFLSNISHELRTPLTPIKGYAEILERRQVPKEKARQFVRGILDSTERLERIVGLLVDFSAMEAGRLSPRVAPVDVAVLVQKLASDWSSRSPRHTFVTDVAPDLPKVIGDERLLRRSLEEVIDNAVKFSPDGGTIRLQARGVDGDGGRVRRPRAVRIAVSDEGIGIPAEDLPKVFYDFHQLDGSETRTFGGLGLGLAFVQRIVEQHDGTIDVDSEPGKGTKLSITLPAVAVED